MFVRVDVAICLSHVALSQGRVSQCARSLDKTTRSSTAQGFGHAPELEEGARHVFVVVVAVVVLFLGLIWRERKACAIRRPELGMLMRRDPPDQSRRPMTIADKVGLLVGGNVCEREVTLESRLGRPRG